jgi:hypothetical protein
VLLLDTWTGQVDDELFEHDDPHESWTGQVHDELFEHDDPHVRYKRYYFPDNTLYNP